MEDIKVQSHYYPENPITMEQWFRLHGVSTNVNKKLGKQERHVLDMDKFMKKQSRIKKVLVGIKNKLTFA